MAGDHLSTKRPREDEHNESNIVVRLVEHARQYYGGTLTILFGPHEKKFVIHKDKLTAKSNFFKAAISREWKEVGEEILRPPEIPSDTFRIYNYWVYSNVVRTKSSTRQVIELYMIGDFLDDVRLRNMTMRYLVASINLHRTVPRPELITLIFNNTPANSLLRSWILDIAAEYYDRASFAKHDAIFPKDSVLQIALRFLPEAPAKIDSTFFAEGSKYLELEEGGADNFSIDGGEHL